MSYFKHQIPDPNGWDGTKIREADLEPMVLRSRGRDIAVGQPVVNIDKYVRIR